jgi:cell division protein FtsZ
VAATIESIKLCPLLHTTEFSRKADRLLVNIIGGTDLTLPMVNELMTAITEQYGRDSHVTMGAVIDESMGQRLEVCVIGTTDVGGRNLVPRRSQAGARGTTSPFKPSGAKTATVAAAAVPAVAATPAAKAEQNEFLFNEAESRGYFDKTDRNLFEGQDLDVPTYLRKGLKIAV